MFWTVIRRTTKTMKLCNYLATVAVKMLSLSGHIRHRLQPLGVVFFRHLSSQNIEEFEKSYQDQAFMGV
jgi:hypothetical protein